MLILTVISLAAVFAYSQLSFHASAQDTVTGAFEGNVSDPQKNPIRGASVQITNQATGVPVGTRSDDQGRFYVPFLPPGVYTIRVSAAGFRTGEITQQLFPTRPNQIVPVPVTLQPETAVPTATPVPEASPVPGVTPTTTEPQVTTLVDIIEQRGSVDINTSDGRRDGVFSTAEVEGLPLGATTLTRTFDELALFLPGVVLPPQTLGLVAGPGVGPGVGSAGQFSVNGLRSRSNNFTVDGSDNNDEDIGVRRQGFFALVPQPIESIEGYQVITLLPPAQYGRNVGAQVNAQSKSGTNEHHATLFGFFNSSQLNARGFFDTVGGSRQVPLRAGNRNVFIDCPNFTGVGCTPATVRLNTGGEDSFTLGQGGITLGGPFVPGRMFYFISLEGQLLNGNKEVNFAVPTVEQRGVFRSGATGLSSDPFFGGPLFSPFLGSFVPFDFATSVSGDAIFSLFPFPNNPGGVYGENTFTQVLQNSAEGKVASGKVDANFKIRERQQFFTARYNFTHDWRDIPVVGGALFSRLRPVVRTQNLSTFLNGAWTDSISNQLRFSHGRTRLRFDEGRDTEFLLPVRRNFTNPEDARFLLNARFLANNTLPFNPAVFYTTLGTGETETQDLGSFLGPLGPIGQVNIAGFSPVGVDVFNFPQRRVNNTYQLADTLTWRAGGHTISFGTDMRRTELISDLPRNSRPLITFNGAPRIVFDPATGGFAFAPNVPGAINPFVRPEDFAAAGAPSGVFQSIALPGRSSYINLRYYQLDFFVQDEWRARRDLSLSFGLRYQYTTVPREIGNRIESTFGAPLPALVSGLGNFIAGRTSIFDRDTNNFGPRVSFAYSPQIFGDKYTVIRAGYGLLYDQILGAVVSQSRNVFPTFTTINFGGGCCDVLNLDAFTPDGGFNIFNPLQTFYFVPALGRFVPIIQPGTLNTLNPELPQSGLIQTTFNFFPAFGTGRPFGATLPSRGLESPMAHHYAVTVEQELARGLIVSAAYVGTLGRKLIRFTTPNLGPNYLVVPVFFEAAESSFGGGAISGFTLDPGSLTSAGTLTGGRPVNTIGPIFRFETTASSRYDALQVQARGRLRRKVEYQVAYTFSKAEDDVSDVFDLAGASALPQNSLTFAGERADANFDARHRFSYNFLYSFPTPGGSATRRAVLGGFSVAGTGQFQTGQPFTVNSLFDINLDGNLTDRLNSTAGVQVTGDRSQPLRLTGDPRSLLAAIGQDGMVPRNSFRAGNLLLLNLAMIKDFMFTDDANTHKLTFRMEVFNITNRSNFGIPVRFLEAAGFGRATDTITPGRRIQFALKYTF